MLGTTEAAVNSTLQRARAAFETRLPATDRERAALPASARERELAGRFADAFQSGDVDGVVALLTDDASFTMPPETLEVLGPEAIGRFLSTCRPGGELDRFRLRRDPRQRTAGVRLLPSRPPVPDRPRERDHGAHARRPSGIAAITVFHDTSVFPHFGLPRTLRVG